MSTPLSVPERFVGLVDDAAVFPPGLMPLPEAITQHAAHLASDHRDLVGPLVLAGADLTRAANLIDPRLYPEGLPVSVIVPSPAEIPQALRQVGEAPGRGRLVLAGLEVKLDPATAVAPQVEQIADETAAVRSAPADGAGPGVRVYVEALRPGHDTWPALVHAVSGPALRLKFRTGGTEATGFPDETEVATWIHDATRAGVPFKCTAGLHHAVRHTAPDTGFEHHGYLNILLAAVAAIHGGDVSTIAAVLGERDATRLAARVQSAGDDELRRARASFVSYGSCSIAEPLEDLIALRLIEYRSSEPA